MADNYDILRGDHVRAQLDDAKMRLRAVLGFSGYSVEAVAALSDQQTYDLVEELAYSGAGGLAADSALQLYDLADHVLERIEKRLAKKAARRLTAATPADA